MGITMAASAILMKQLMTMDLDAVGITQLACPVLVLSGMVCRCCLECVLFACCVEFVFVCCVECV